MTGSASPSNDPVTTKSVSFNALLEIAGYNLGLVRLLRHKDPTAVRGRSVYELWRDDRAAFDLYQSVQGAAAHRSLVNSTLWASFVGTPAGDTMFVGLYRSRYSGLSDADIVSPTNGETDVAGSIHRYSLVEERYLSEYAGRLFIEWGDAKRSWLQLGNNRKPKSIIEIKREFAEPAFPGYLELVEDLSRIPLLPLSWIAALSAVCGVYVLTCPRTKELYIGSATGKSGFFGRWSEYARDNHGGNIQLKSRDPSDYQVSILEVAGSSQTTLDIQSMESRWKRKLQTRNMGLNRN